MDEIKKAIHLKLFELQDLEYREFCSKLMPTVDKETVIGIRTPQLRKLAREAAKMPDINQFMDELPHKYYEENNLHGMIIETIKDYDECIYRLNEFLPYVDNWATCDIISPKIFKKHTEELLNQIRNWIDSEHTYTVRYGIGMLMRFYLDDEFKPEYLEMVSRIESDQYYINMMIAWYFATSLVKQYGETIPYIERKALNSWTHNKAIQKAIESNRVTDENKAYLRTLKIK